VITGPKSLFEARCRERGYQLSAVMPCVVKQDGDRWTVDVAHPAYPRAKAKSAPATVSDDIQVMVYHRREACSKCKWLRHTKYDQPYCKRNCKRNGKTCQRLAVGKYTVALLKSEPWCEPWKQCYSTSPQPKDNPR